MSANKDQQWTLVVKCLAVALKCIDVDEVTANRLKLEAAFGHAWRAWPTAFRFPSIEPNDLVIYIRKSKRRGNATGYFEAGTTYRPLIKEASDWGDPTEVLDLLDEGHAAAWISLARALQTELNARS